MTPELHAPNPVMTPDAIDAEFAALMGQMNPDAAPEGLTALTEENIDAEIARMFSTVTEDDVALIGAANGVAARSLTGNLTAAETAELEAADARGVQAAQEYLASSSAAVAANEATIGAAIDAIFADNEDSDDRELVNA